MKKDCKLCLRDVKNILMESEHFFVVKGDMSVAYGHLVIVSKRHVESYFQLNSDEVEQLQMLMRNAKSHTEATLSPDGYNIGINVGEWAGQDNQHVEVHLIPRFAGDVPATELKGGIKNLLKKDKKERV